MAIRRSRKAYTPQRFAQKRYQRYEEKKRREREQELFGDLSFEDDPVDFISTRFSNANIGVLEKMDYKKLIGMSPSTGAIRKVRLNTDKVRKSNEKQHDSSTTSTENSSAKTTLTEISPFSLAAVSMPVFEFGNDCLSLFNDAIKMQNESLQTIEVADKRMEAKCICLEPRLNSFCSFCRKNSASKYGKPCPVHPWLNHVDYTEECTHSMQIPE